MSENKKNASYVFGLKDAQTVISRVISDFLNAKTDDKLTYNSDERRILITLESTLLWNIDELV